MDALIAAITSQAGVAILVLMAANLGLVGVLRELHKSIREDRQASDQAADRLTEAITALRIELAGRKGGTK